MIATMTKDPYKFNSEYKQRVSDYLRANPSGDYNHFLENWKRSYQVSRGTFDEVYFSLQKAGAIRVTEGSKTYDQMRKEIEKDLLKKGLLLKPEPQSDYLPAPLAPERPVIPAASAGTQAPVQFPNANAFEDDSQTKKDDNVAKEVGIKQLTEEQRAILDQAFQRTPNISYEDLNAKLGVTLKKLAYSVTKNAVKNGLWHFKSMGGANLAPRAAMRDSMTSGVGMIPFINKTKISKPETVGWLNTDGRTQEEINFIGNLFPSIISELFAPEMTFKFFQTKEFGAEGAVDKLELKRMR